MPPLAGTPKTPQPTNGVEITHGDYDANVTRWKRARDVMGGEDAVKAGRESYLPLLDGMNDNDYLGYQARASFFNASARTADGLVGMIFRAPPAITKPNAGAVVTALDDFLNDADMRGIPFEAYAKAVVEEVMQVGRAGTLIDWEGTVENRAYAVRYCAEQITNWRVERVRGKMMLTLVVLSEEAQPVSLLEGRANTAGDGGNDSVTTPEVEYGFANECDDQYRVLRLVKTAQPENAPATAKPTDNYQYLVEIWQKSEATGKDHKWELVQTITPTRRGKALDQIPFVFHGPKNALPDVDKLPLDDVIQVNLHHYRLSADYNHGLHFTALPTAWVAGFPKETQLKIGSSVAWITDVPTARAGFLEFTGQGLTSFVAALDRDENLMAILGARLLEKKTKAAETAQALEIRQSGEGSVLMNMAIAGSESLTQVLKWVYWWNSTEEHTGDVTDDLAVVKLNTDFIATRLTSDEIVALIKAWQARGISQETLLHNFRQGDILPPGTSIEDEKTKIETETPPTTGTPPPDPSLRPPAGGA